MKTPSFIDPKTGRRFENVLMEVPGLGRPADQVTAEEFANAVGKGGTVVNHYFDQIGWPEG